MLHPITEAWSVYFLFGTLSLFMSMIESRTPKSRKAYRAASTRSDCQTCATRQVTCDRFRPRCGTCERSGNACGGYSMQLSWQPGFSISRKPVKRSITRRSEQRTTSGQQFEFVSENPVETLHCRGRPSLTTPKSSPILFVDNPGGFVEANEPLTEITDSACNPDFSSLVIVGNEAQVLDHLHTWLNVPGLSLYLPMAPSVNHNGLLEKWEPFLDRCMFPSLILLS